MKRKSLKRICAVLCAITMIPLSGFQSMTSQAETTQTSQTKESVGGVRSDLKQVTISDIGKEIVNKDGTHSYSSVVGTNFAGTLFSQYVTISGSANSGPRMMFSCRSSSSTWEALSICFLPSTTTRTYIQIENVNSYFGGATNKQQLKAQDFGLTTFDEQTILLQISTEIVDHDGGGSKNDVKFGIYINGQFNPNGYIYFDNQSSKLTASINYKQYQSSIVYRPYHYTAPDLEEFTISDLGYDTIDKNIGENKTFNLADSGIDSLEGTLFSQYVTSAGSQASGPRIMISNTANNGWTGLDITLSPKQVNNPTSITVADSNSYFGSAKKTQTLNATDYGLTNFGGTWLLQVSTEVVEHDGDGSQNDVKFGIYINGKLNINGYIYFDDQASKLTSYVHYKHYSSDNSFTSCPYTAPAGFTPITISTGGQETISQNANINFANGGINSLDKTWFSQYVTLNGTAKGPRIMLSHPSESTWKGLAIVFENSTTVKIWDSQGYFTNNSGNDIKLAETYAKNYGLTSFNTTFLLQVSTELVDHDGDGDTDDIKFGIYINGKLNRNGGFIYIDNPVNALTTRVDYKYVSDNGNVFKSYYSNGEYMEMDTYKSGNTYPEKDGYVFAGWYTDNSCATAIQPGTTQGTAFAKFVDEDVLSVKYQLPSALSAEDSTTTLRLVTTVDSEDYNAVGFEIEVDGVKKEGDFTTRNVYRTITGFVNGSQKNYTTLVFSSQSEYFMALTFEDVPLTGDASVLDKTITVTPVWQTLDGTTVYGTQRDIVISK